MKSVRISDEAYKKIIKRSKKDKRTITATIDIMIDESIANGSMANGATPPNTSPYPPIDWGSESDPEVEHSKRRAKDMTYDEMVQISQRLRNEAYRDQEMGDEE